MIITSRLNDIHEKLGAKFTDFAGFKMPIYYSSIKNEHITVRKKVGLFDVSHMSNIWIEGKDAEKLISLTTIEDAKKINPEEIHIRISSPPVCFPCFLGIDMQEIDKFWYVHIAEKMGYDKFDSDIYRDGEIKDEIIAKLGYDLNVDSIAYLSYNGLKKVIGENHCYGCWNPGGYHKIFREDVMKLAGNSSQLLY